MPFADNYKPPDIAAAYVEHRPHYPQSVYDIILNFLKSDGSPRKEKCKIAVDLGCGPGISTFPLSPHFESVIGIDVSEAQIEEGRKLCSEELYQNVTFRVGDANDLSFLPDGSVDLITLGTALHWLDVEWLCKESSRVLRPGGVLAAFGYGAGYYAHVDGTKFDAITESVAEMFDTYGESVCQHVKNGYRDLFPIFQRNFADSKRDDSVRIDATYSVEGFCGLIQSYHMYPAMRAAKPNDPDPLDAMAAEVYKAYNNRPPNDAVRLITDVFIILCRK
jgi:ubiquinone/menaquinone biosynthesis C-methylase UbiE